MKKVHTHFRIIAILCLIIFSIILISCGGNDNKSAQNVPAQSQQNTTVSIPTSSPQAVTPPSTVTEKPKTVEPSKMVGQGPNGEGIKGHIDKKGVKIYHLPGDPYYSRTTHVAQWFFTEKDAVAAGYRHIK